MNYDKENERILKQIEEVNKRFSDLLAKYVIKFSVNGTLEGNDTLATLEQDLIKILKDAGYSEAANEFFAVFQTILQSTVREYKRAAQIDQVLRESKAAELVTNSTIDSLKNIGIQDNFINPLAKQIRQLILTGSTYGDFQNFLKNSFTDNQKLTQYVSTITVDTFSQYDGALQNEIKQTYKPTKGRYIGDEIENSRPFCIDMEDSFGNNPISIDQLKIKLDEYCPNGIPSEDKITITTPIDGKTKSVKKGAGMIEGTTVNNFDIVKGGHQCRHIWRWILD